MTVMVFFAFKNPCSLLAFKSEAVVAVYVDSAFGKTL